MITVITGNMKAGKTSCLINFAKQLENSKIKIFYPACCNKKENYVVSREDNKKLKAIKIYEIKDFYNHIKDLQIILIDEFTFICSSNQIDDFMIFLEYCDKNNIDVFLFGLQNDYLSRPFDLTQRILPFADNIIVLKANCEICGEPASRTIRYINGEIDINNDSNIILLENENIEYKSVCRKCFREKTNLSAIK